MGRSMTTLAPAGYSKKPLHEKLGYRPGQAAAFVALPAELEPLVSCVAFKSVARPKTWAAKLPVGGFDLIHAFTKARTDLDTRLSALQTALKPDGMIWVSWPKKASKVETDVTEDRIRDAALALDLVDVKVAAVDPVWSGLKLVIRKDRRARDK
jgi:hypothetical protein